jgi:hypothetical protein
MRNEQAAMSPGHGCAVRGTAHLLMVEGRRRRSRSRSQGSLRSAPPPRGFAARSPSPGNPGEEFRGNDPRLNVGTVEPGLI